MDVEVKCQKETLTSVEEKSRNRIQYKLFLIFLKIVPMVMAGLYLLNTVLSYLDIDYSIISYLTGVGFIPWLFILIASYTLKFCEYHRMFLWYIIVNDIICWIDDNYTIPISNRDYLSLHFIIAGIFLFFILYLHQKIIFLIVYYFSIWI